MSLVDHLEVTQHQPYRQDTPSHLTAKCDEMTTEDLVHHLTQLGFAVAGKMVNREQLNGVMFEHLLGTLTVIEVGQLMGVQTAAYYALRCSAPKMTSTDDITPMDVNVTEAEAASRSQEDRLRLGGMTVLASASEPCVVEDVNVTEAEVASRAQEVENVNVTKGQTSTPEVASRSQEDHLRLVTESQPKESELLQHQTANVIEKQPSTPEVDSQLEEEPPRKRSRLGDTSGSLDSDGVLLLEEDNLPDEDVPEDCCALVVGHRRFVLTPEQQESITTRYPHSAIAIAIQYKGTMKTHDPFTAPAEVFEELLEHCMTGAPICVPRGLSLALTRFYSDYLAIPYPLTPIYRDFTSSVGVERLLAAVVTEESEARRKLKDGAVDDLLCDVVFPLTLEPVLQAHILDCTTGGVVFTLDSVGCWRRGGEPPLDKLHVLGASTTRLARLTQRLVPECEIKLVTQRSNSGKSYVNALEFMWSTGRQMTYTSLPAFNNKNCKVLCGMVDHVLRLSDVIGPQPQYFSWWYT